MRNVKNITVAVSAELYRQTRKLAAEYDTTVTAMVAHLLQRLPDALERTQFPVCGPKRARATRANSHATRIAAAWLDSANPSLVSAPTSSPKIACETVRPPLSHLLSMISDPILQAHAAAVFQYADANRHRNKDLPESHIDAEEQ
jgi:hypothetical protein